MSFCSAKVFHSLFWQKNYSDMMGIQKSPSFNPTGPLAGSFENKGFLKRLFFV